MVMKEGECREAKPLCQESDGMVERVLAPF